MFRIGILLAEALPLGRVIGLARRRSLRVSLRTIGFSADLLAAALLILSALIVLWRPIVHGAVFLPLDLITNIAPWRYSYEHTPYVNPFLSDLIWEYYPRRLLATQMIQHGQLPLWNPNILGGMPLFADGYSALLYPLSVLFVLLPTSQAFGWYALIHLALSGIGAYTLARVLGMRPIAALVAGLIYQGCGFTIVWMVFPEFHGVIAWLPLLLACVEWYERRTLESGRVAYRPAICAAVILALCVLCQLQLAAYAGMALAIYWLARRATTAPWRLPGAVLALSAVATLGLLLSAVQWIPTVELALMSQRVGLTGELGDPFLTVARLMQFIVPTAYSPYTRTADMPWGPPTPGFLHPYIGLLPLALCLIGMWRVRTARQLSVLLLGLSIAGLLAIPPVALRAIPLVNQLPATDRLTMILSLAMALLAAFGFEALLKGWGAGETRSGGDTEMGSRIDGAPGWVSWVSRGLCVVTFATIATAFLLRLRPFQPESRVGVYLTLLQTMQPWPRVIAVGTVLLLILGWRLSRCRPEAAPSRVLALVKHRWYIVGTLALALIALDLGYYGIPHHSSADPQTLFEPTSDLLTAINQTSVHSDLTDSVLFPPTRTSRFFAADHGLYRVAAAEWNVVTPNTFSIFGVQDVRGYASLFSGKYARFIRSWQQERRNGPELTLQDLHHMCRTHGMLDLMGVRYLVFPPKSKQVRRCEALGLELVQRSDEGLIYRNPTALARAFLVHRAESFPNDDALIDRMTSPGFAVSSTALLGEPAPPLAPSTGSEQVTIRHYQPMAVQIDVTASASAMLVLSDTYYPGWEAEIDGQPTKLYVVNTVLRGVAVPAGSHQVEFIYRPRAVIYGALISAMTLVALLSLAVWRYLPGHRRRDHA